MTKKKEEKIGDGGVGHQMKSHSQKLCGQCMQRISRWLD
jgi:hypothetical protein